MDNRDKSKEELLNDLQELNKSYLLLEERYRRDIKEYQDAKEVLYNERILLRTIIDNIPDSIYTKDITCHKTLANLTELQHLKAISEEEVIGKDDYDFYPEDIADKFLADDLLVIQTGEPVINREEYIPDENGQKRWLLSSKIPLYNKYNRIIGLIGIGRDITDRKESELLLKEKNEEIEAQNEEYQQLNEELRQINEELLIAKEKTEKSEERYKSIINSITDYIYTVQIRDNKAVETHHSEACIAVTGYSVAEFESDPFLWINMVVPEDRLLVAESTDKLLENKDIYSFEVRIVHKNGSIRWVSDTLVPKYDYNGYLISYDGIITDITDRKQAEFALVLRESYLSAIIENQPGLLWLKDINSRFLFVNTAFSKSCGLSSPSLIFGKSDFEIWPGELADKYVEDDKKVILSNKPYKVEEQIFDNGLLKWYETFKTTVLDDKGNVIGTTGYSHDITERKQSELLIREKTNAIELQNQEYIKLNEELKQINQELIIAKEKAEESDHLKTAFLQNMNHEIRTPMNAIMGFANLLEDNFNNKEKLKQFSAIINNRTRYLLEIINDILDISKIESGQLPVNYEECDLSLLFEDLTSICEEQQIRMNKQHIKFSLHSYCDPSEAFIIVDKVKLKQIFINLISNALKFTENGKIEGGCKLDTNHNLIFYVSDTGIGIPVDKQDCVFERFVQLNQNTDKLTQGTGLGLSIVKGLVHLLGGEIFLESEYGKGSTFSFTINYKSTPKFKSKPLIIEKQQELHFPDKNILIVEDDPYNMEYLKEILTIGGLNFLTAINGKEAIQISYKEPIDLILMDIRLPDLDGYEVTRQIKKYKPDLVIIAQTAYVSNEEIQKARDAGCTDYISKPTNKNILLSMIGNIFQNQCKV